MLEALRILLAIFALGVILPASGCLIMIYAETRPTESKRNAETSRQNKFEQWNRNVENLGVCGESEKTDDEIKRMFYYENVAKKFPLQSRSLRNIELADYEVVRDESHAPHQAYLSFEEFIAANRDLLRIRRGGVGRISEKGFKGFFSGVIRARLIFPDGRLYQPKEHRFGRSIPEYYFDNCGRFIPTRNPHERRYR